MTTKRSKLDDGRRQYPHLPSMRKGAEENRLYAISDKIFSLALDQCEPALGTFSPRQLCDFLHWQLDVHFYIQLRYVHDGELSDSDITKLARKLRQRHVKRLAGAR